MHTHLMAHAHDTAPRPRQLPLFEPLEHPPALARERALHGIAKVRRGIELGETIAS